jgi:GNAT superfamily N-acetyltransferase
VDNFVKILTLIKRARCWWLERRLPYPTEPERLDADLVIPMETARQLIPDNPDRPLWVELRRAYGPGRPGVTRETATDWIIRSDAGCVVGGARVFLLDASGEAVSPDVAIDPRYRRKGYATRLYEAIAAAGVDIERGSDSSLRFGSMTRMGYAFMVGRRSKRPHSDETTIDPHG